MNLTGHVLGISRTFSGNYPEMFCYVLRGLAMFCYVLICFATLFCYVLLCFATFCYIFAMFCYVWLCFARNFLEMFRQFTGHVLECSPICPGNVAVGMSIIFCEICLALLCFAMVSLCVCYVLQCFCYALVMFGYVFPNKSQALPEPIPSIYRRSRKLPGNLPDMSQKFRRT